MTKLIATFIVAAAQLLALPLAHAFPDGAKALPTPELKERFAGKVFTVSPKDGAKWRVEFRGDYVFIDTSRGFRSSGPWTIEGSSLCTQLRGRPRVCNEVRLVKDILHVQRDTGEVVQYLPQ